MKLVAFSAALLAMTAAPALAQTAASAPAPAMAAPAAGAVATPKFSLDTPIETIAADPAGKAVLDADFPGMLTHPAYDQFKGMSLTAVQPMSQGAITDEQMAKAKTDLTALK
ncbi:hypothetical protein GCM10009087_34110 [Sphingomonas oligophenolica]|uniref:Uncharacterized protein n=1 Tax=Sphingomonas oligophenolica TaxID=301154 RepID=A0ABU9XYV6_9SPHN